MADLEAVLADVSYLMAMEKSKCTPAARASKKIVLPDPRYRRDSSFAGLQVPPDLHRRLVHFFGQPLPPGTIGGALRPEAVLSSSGLTRRSQDSRPTTNSHHGHLTSDRHSSSSSRRTSSGNRRPSSDSRPPTSSSHPNSSSHPTSSLPPTSSPSITPRLYQRFQHLFEDPSPVDSVNSDACAVKDR